MSELIDRQEILDRLDRVIIRGVYDDFYEGHLLTAEAVKETILSLPSAEPDRASCKQVTGKLDLINRQDAVDAIEQMQMPIMRSEFPEEQYVFKGMSEALRAIKDLPSTQPEERTEERTETHACDCISRQDAIDLVRNCNVKEVTPDYMLIDKAEIMTELMMLPSAPLYTPDEIQTMQDLEWAQMEKMYEIGKADRKKGKWLGKEQFANSPEFYSWQCSVCGCVLEDPTLNKPYPFCPNCGSRNIKEGDAE